MRFLVTGGAGFIGSHIVDELIELGHRVVVVDSLDPAAHAVGPDYLNDGAEYRWCQVEDLDSRPELLEGFDGVCHQAAKVGLGVDFGDVVDYVRRNDVATAVLLRGLMRVAFSGPFVLASSKVVYGEGQYRCDAHGLVRPAARTKADLDTGRFEVCCPHCGRAVTPAPVPEDAELKPLNVYAATKLHQEHLAACYSQHADVPVTALRYSNVYGPRMPRDTPYAGVASIFRSSCEDGRVPKVFEDGQQLRDFVHVRDVARANVLALTAGEPKPGAFNVAYHTPHSVLEMAQALADAFGRAAPAPKTTGQYRLGDVRHQFTSATKASEELGFTARVTFAEGMREFATASLRAPVHPTG